MAALPALFGLLLVSLVSGQGVDIEPKYAVRRVGDEIRVLCRVAHKIDSCRIQVGKSFYRLVENDSTGDIVYYGEGLRNSQCGAIIRNIKEEWNGNISCIVPPPSGNQEISGVMRLVVATPPKDVRLYTPHQANFREGEVLLAQCASFESRPAANISWFMVNTIGEEIPIREGLHKPIVTVTPGSDLETVQQNLTLTLTPDDGNKQVICRAEHVALDAPRVDARQIIVEYPPKALEPSPITIFGLKLGSEGRLNVTVRANPAPSAEWTVGDQRLTPQRGSVDGSVFALEPVPLGNGFFNCSLVLTRLAKEDVDRSYFLRVRNELGHEEFAVRLSTLDEPAGMELDTGAIVGIVIAVLVLLVAVFLIVFAKATDRWCFGGRSHRVDLPDGGDSEAPLPPHDERGAENPTHDHEYISNARRRDAKGSGESSDTESAAGVQRSRLAALGARVRAALPRGKDKVQNVEAAQNDAEPLSEKKEGVVYAELALKDAARDKPPPPSAEYAEIVLSTPESKPEETKE